MVKKTLRTKDTDLDSSLDFEDFNFELGDVGNDREPKSKPVKSFARGVKSGVADTELIKKIIRNNLPKEYGETFDQLDELQRGGREYAESVLKEAKPAIGNVANAIEKFLPNNFKATKTKLDQIRQWAEKSDDLVAAQSKEQQQKDIIGLELARVFEKQAAVEAQASKVESQEKAVDRGLSIAQHKDVLSALFKIAGYTGTSSQYTTNVTAAWQKKSLETQYRQLFLQQDLLEETKKSNAAVLANLAAITKNTALPEYRKTQQDEAFMLEARRKFASKIVDASQGFLKKGLSKMKDDISGVISNITDISGMLSLASEMQALEDEFDPRTLEDRFIEMGGKKTGQWLASKGGKKVFDMLKKNPKAVEGILRGQQFLRSFKQDGAGLATDLFEKGRDKDGILGFLSQYLGDTFTLNQPNYAMQGYSAKSIYDAAPMTKKMAMSVTDVIPGYLARILQEQTMLRTGTAADMVKFDWRSGKFSTSSKIIESVKKSVSAEELSRNNEYYLKDVMAAIEDNVDLNQAEREDIARALLKKGVSGEAMNPSKMTDTDHWTEHLKEYETADKMAQAMKAIFGTDSDKEFYGVGMNANKKAKANDFIKNVQGLKNLRKDLFAQAQFLMDNDMLDEAQKAELIDKFGALNIDLIDRNTVKSSSSFKGRGSADRDLNQEYSSSKTDVDGHDSGMVQKAADLLKKGFNKARQGFSADKDGYLVDEKGERKLDSDGNPIIVGTSDVHAKRDIKSTQPLLEWNGKGSTLNRLANTPIKDWRYKQGKGDGGLTTNTGPMAQDMRRNFGEQMAPGGTTIDLVNANGMTMKAVQELNAKVDSFGMGGGSGGSGGGGSGTTGPGQPMSAFDALLGIYTNTYNLVEQGRSMININAEGFKSMMGGLGASFADMDFSGMGAEAKARFEAGMKGMKTGSSSLLGKLGDFISYMTGETISGGIRRGKQLGKGLWAGAKMSGRFVADVAGATKVKALETFDVYVGNEEEPRMVAIKMKQNMYTDARTGEVIKTRQQVRAAVHGIKEETSEGNFYVLLSTELESAYFVNTYKNAIERLIQGTAGLAKSSVKSAFDHIVSPLFKGALDLSKKLSNFGRNLMDQPFDIFVAGKPDSPALVAKKMRDGDYIDFASGEEITRPSQIKGAVWDRFKSEMAVTIDDFRTGLVDIHGKPVESSALMRAGKFAIGAAAGAAFHLGKWSLGKLAKAPGILGSLSSKGTAMLKGLADKIGMPSIVFGGESISILKDIREILRYQAGLTGDAKDLSGIIGNSKIADNVKASIKDAVSGSPEGGNSKPGMFSNMFAKAKSWFGGKKEKANPNGVYRGAGELVNLNTPQVYGGGNALALAGKAAGGLLGWGGRKALANGKIQKFLPANAASLLGALVPTEEKPQGTQPLLSNKASQLLLENLSGKKSRFNKEADDIAYRDIPGEYRKGSWQEREANAKNVNKETIRAKDDVRVYATKNIFEMIAGVVGGVGKKMKDWLSNKGNPLEAAEDIADAAGTEERRRRKGRKGRWGGKWGTAAKYTGRALGAAGAAYSAYSAYDNIKEGNYGTAALDAGMAVAGGGFAMGGLKGAAGALGKMAGGAGRLAMGAGRMLFGSAGTIARGAMMLAPYAGAIASGIGAVLTSPVTLTALGVAALGYGGYKAYKFFTRKKFNKTEIMRMLEYGLRGADIEYMRKIYELESMMDGCSTLSDTTLKIDEKKFKVKDALEIFEIGEKDTARIDSFTTWFENRFKPIYAKWRSYAKQVGGDDKMEWFDKAQPAKLLEVFKLFKITSEAYSVASSPFKSIKMNTDASVITNYKDEWLMSFKETAIDKKDEQLGKETAKVGQAVLAARAAGVEPEFDSPKVATGADAISQTNDVNAAGAKVTVASEFASSFVSSTVNAVDAIRYKSYGLVVMKASAISALRNLEAITMDYVKIDSSGKAAFDGDVKEIIKKAGGYFGVTAGDGEFATKWTNWYMNRFLPVYLAMHSALFAVTKRAELRTNLQYIERARASESLVIARAMMGAKGIWEVKDFAFKGQVSGLNPAVCDENILYIENIASEETVKEQKANKEIKPGTAAEAVKPAAPVTAPENKPQEAPQQRQQQSTGPTTAAQAMGMSDEPEAKGYTDAAPGKSDMIKTTASTAGAGSLPVAPGELFSGAGGLAGLTLANGANIDGLHPSVKRLFLGMAEEYFKLTGKKIQVNTAYRSFAEQEALFKKYGPGKAARPGSSLHEYGLALDVQSNDLAQLEKLGLMRKYGFTRPLGSEPWHIEPAGIHDNAVRQKAKKDHAYATQFIESGIGRGGGGLGSRGRGGELRRDDTYAKQLFDAASQVAKTEGDKQGEAPPAPAVTPGQQMTKAASTGASSTLNGGGLSSGMPDVETKEGKVSYTASAANDPAFSSERVSQEVKDLEKTSYDITKGHKGTVGAYTSLPEANGSGWSGTGLLIKEAAKMVGVDPGLAAAIAAKESSLNPNAQGKNSAAGNSVAQGLYQFMPDTWKDVLKKYGKKYGIPENTSPLDPRANALMGMEYFKSSGDGTTVGSYLGHMLGPGGWNTFKRLKDTDYPAMVMAKAAANNPNIFYVGGNKSQPRTKAQFSEFIGTAINKQLTDFKIPLSINSDTAKVPDTATSTPAANDSSASVSSSSSVTRLSDTGGGSTLRTSAPLTDAPERSAAPTRREPPSGFQSMAAAQPVASGVRTAPVQENDKNGIPQLLKVANDHLVEAQKASDILVEIRDLMQELVEDGRFDRNNRSKDNKKSSTDQVVEATKSQPSTLPESFVQRRRFA